MKNLLCFISFLFFSFSSQAGLIGQWTFENGSEYKDSAGNFGDLTLVGDATIQDGYLDVNGTGRNNQTGWAYSWGYTGNTILDKTLVSWVSLDSLSATSGSALTLDNMNGDNFDSIDYAESNTNKWMNGSSYYRRTSSFNSNAIDTTINQLKKLVITYHDLDNVIGGNMLITGYLDDILLGSYQTSNSSYWNTNNAQVIFGKRHTPSGNDGPGALDAKIYEARIYDTALTSEEVKNLKMADVPEPSTLAIFALGMMGLASRRFKKQS